MKTQSHLPVNEQTVAELWETLLIRLEQVEGQADRVAVGGSVRLDLRLPGIGREGRRRDIPSQCGVMDSSRLGHHGSQHRPSFVVWVSAR